MTISIDAARLEPATSRRAALALLGTGAIALGLGIVPEAASAAGEGGGEETVLTEALVLRDPDIPVAGNVDGDISIVEYFDYQCPYCRKIEPELRQVVQDDGKVRLIWKDWPILGPVSVIASRMAPLVISLKLMRRTVMPFSAFLSSSMARTCQEIASPSRSGSVAR